MDSIGENSAAMESTTEKPVVIRVKRKSSQSRLDAFWLEINERPLKRPLLDFQKLSIAGESAHGTVEELKKKKKNVFVHHVETVSSSEATVDMLQSFVPHSGDAIEVRPKCEERKETLKKDQILAQNARFEQIRRTCMGNKEAPDGKAIQEICHFYDVVRVDVEESSSDVQEEEMSLEDKRLLSSYLPLLRELIPSAADDIESDIRDYMSKPDDYVYDYYTVSDAMEMDDKESFSPFPFPLVTVEEEDFYDGPDDDTEYETDDSNAEAHPHNEYPDETSLEEDEGEDGESSEEEGEDEDGNGRFSEFKASRHTLREDEIYDGDCTFDYEDDANFGYDDDDDGEDWR